MYSLIECCATCKYRKQYEEPTEADVDNECRRYPPQAYGDMDGAYSTFPGVRLEEWCGEWKAVEE